MLTVYLLRHGETFYNADGNRYCGTTDIGLTEKGVQQAHAAAALLQGIDFDAVYSSPLQRAYLTARIASGEREVTADPRLMEANFGNWEGKTRAEFVAENPALWNAWAENPEHTRAGETGNTALEIVQRVDDFFNQKQKEHDGKTIMVVAHNGLNRFYMAWKLGMPLRNYRRLVQDNSTITIFNLDDAGEFSLLKLNAR
ncbi:histidine phosphatase family protein [Dyadobacter sp. CY343]|uniref:histidine phosphatase family protein n=1 Tax=Dyadobacter sp. CY343 TaxID=2907299 RepID=UPI001F377B97|nr:histidine phosphatase family protein [Dyadobacter sp. CY343]MCE7059806.1 histidine phosphatase family protein [Dyadobacter sp. CY343]